MAKSFVTDINDFTPSNDFQVPENPVEENIIPNNEVPDFTIDIDDINMEGPKIDAVDPFISTVKHYDSNSSRHNFERYYSHDLFGKLGFNPMYDNESIYNSQSSSIQEYGRAIKQLPGLFGLGLMDAATSWYGTTDTKSAREMERMMAVGSSSKGGMDSWGTGFTLSLGYSMGIIAELAAETIAVNAAVGLATWGTGLPASVAASAVNIGRGVGKIHSALNVGKSLFKSINHLGKLKNSKAFYSGIKNSKTLGKAANFLNPLEGTTDFLRAAHKGNLGSKGKVARGLGAFYLDIKNLEIAASEAQLEAGTIKNTLLDEMYSDFYHENGVAPTDEQSKEMAKIASSKADDGFYANASILYMSNKIMFDTLFSSFKVAKNGTQKVVAKSAGKRIIEDTRKGATKRFDIASDNFFNKAKNLYKNPKLAAKAVKDYTLINSSEGFQEVLQEGITASAEERGIEEYKGNKLAGYFYADFLKKSGESLLGSEGWSVFASGFLTGIPMQAVQSGVVGAFQAGYSQTEKGAASKEAQIKALEKRKDILNEMNDKMDSKFKSRLSELPTDKERIESLGIKKDMSDKMLSAVLEEDKKAYEDAKSVIFSEYLLDAIESGGEDMVSENIESLRDLSEEEVKESFQITKEDFDSKLDHMSNQIALVKELVEYRDDNFVNTYNPSMYDKNDPRREIEATKFSLYENLRKSFVTKNYSFKETLRRMNDINSSFVDEVGIGSAAYSSVDFLLDGIKTFKEILSLKQQLDVYKESSEKEDKSKSKVLESKIASLEKYNEAMLYLSSETATKQKGGKEALLSQKKKGYMDYLEIVAKENGQLFDQAKAENSFKLANDYAVLDSESKNLHSEIGLLLNPNFMENVMSNTIELNKKSKEIQTQKDAADLKSFLENEDNHELVDKIYKKFNVFLSPESIDELINKKNMPSRFLEDGIGKNKGNISEIDPSSQKYRDITNFIRTESETKGIKLGNDDANIPFDMSTRKQTKKEEETYFQLAKKYGFEADGSDTELLVSDILSVFFDENNRTSKRLEKDLAAILLRIIPKDLKILITQKGNNPSTISNSGDPIVDARFSASDYVSENYKGEKIPFQISILRAVLDSVVVKELNESAEFKDQMNEIFKKAKSLSKDNTRFEYTNLDIFVKELLVNRDFQMEISEMEGQDESSLWNSFINTIRNTLGLIFKTSINKKSLLNDAINIIASRLDPAVSTDISDTSTVIDTSERTQENTKLTFYTTTKDIESFFKDAHEGLIDLFLKHNESRGYDKNVEKKEDVKIDSNGFKKFLLDEEVRSELTSFMNLFNSKNNRTFYPEFKAVSKTDMGFAVRSRLEELGYESDSFQYNVAKAVEIANAGTSLSDAKRTINKTQEEKQNKINADAELVLDKITSMFKNISLGVDISKTKNDVNKYLDEIAQGYEGEGELGTGITNFTLLNRSDNDIVELIESKLLPETEERLSKEKNIKTMRKGMVLKNSKEQFVVIDKIEKGEVFYHVLGTKEEGSFKKNTMKDKIDLVFAMKMEDTFLNPDKVQKLADDVNKADINLQDKGNPKDMGVCK